MPNIQICKFTRDREIGVAKLTDKLRIIDQRIGILENSWRYSIPFNAQTNAGTTALSFDNSENRFLLCGNSKGQVSIVDFESFTNRDPALEAYPLNHKIMSTRSKSSHAFMVNACQWYPVDTSIFITTGMDKVLKIWDAMQFVSVEDYKFVQSISDFQWQVSKKSSLIALAMSSSNVSLLDPRTGNMAQQIRAFNQRVWSVQWSQSSDHVLATGSDQGIITQWDIRSGKNHLDSVSSPGGIKAANASNDRKDNRKRPLPSKSLAHVNRICCLRVTNDGRFMVSLTQDRNICLWDAMKLKCLFWTKLPEPDNDPISTTPLKFEISNEGRFVWAFVPSGNEVLVVQMDPLHSDGKQVNLAKEGCVHALRGHFQKVMACAYRKAYQQLVTSSTDRLNLIWSSKMDECRFDSAVQTIQRLHEDAFSDED